VIWVPHTQSVVGVTGQTLVTVDLTTRLVRTIGREPSLLGLAAAPDGSSVYTTSLDRTAVRWGLDGGRISTTFRVAAPGTGSFVVAVDRGSLAVAGSGGADVRVWNLATHRPVSPPLRPGPAGGWAAITPDGRAVAGASSIDGRVTIWNARTGTVMRRLTPPEQIGSDWLTFSPDGRLVVSATQAQTGPLTYKHGHTLIWNARTGRLLDDLHQPGDNGVSYAAFSPDQRRIVTVGEGGSVAVWDIPNHKLLRSWTTHDAYTETGIYAPDGTIIATGGFGGGLVELWNARTGTPLEPITSSGQIAPIGFYNHGRRLVVEQQASSFHLQLWDVPQHRLIGQLPVAGHEAAAAISPDGRTLVASSKAGLLTAWPLSTSMWLRGACAIADRNLTRAEWTTFLAALPYQTTCPSAP